MFSNEKFVKKSPGMNTGYEILYDYCRTLWSLSAHVESCDVFFDRGSMSSAHHHWGPAPGSGGS